MKADPYGQLAEQTRARANWRNSGKGEGRCDGCVKFQPRAGGNGKQAGLCLALTYATKPNAVCDRYQVDKRSASAEPAPDDDGPDPERIERLLVLPWQSAEYVRAFSGANLATLRAALEETDDPDKRESLTHLIRSAERSSTQPESTPMTDHPQWAAAFGGGDAPDLDVAEFLAQAIPNTEDWQDAYDSATPATRLAAMERTEILVNHIALEDRLGLKREAEAPLKSGRAERASGSAGLADRPLGHPPYDAAEAGLPAAPIKFMPAETIGADDERNTRRIVERIGRQKLASVISKLLTVSDLLDLREIKESGIYKGFSHIGEDGNCQPISTWEEYCEKVEGRSRQAVDLDLQNFDVLGAEFFESARRIGIGPGKMRELRKLPPDIQEKAQEAAEQGNKSALLEIIELQAEERRKEREQSAKDKAELERQLANKDADLRASRALSDTTAQQLREHQEAELRRKLGTPNQADRDRVVATLNTSADALKSRVLASFRKECLDVLDAHDGESAEFGRIIVAQALGLIMGAARMVGADLGVVPAADARIAYEQGAYAPGEKAWKLAQAELAAGAEG